jgi:hypothetical protein
MLEMPSFLHWYPEVGGQRWEGGEIPEKIWFIPE